MPNASCENFIRATDDVLTEGQIEFLKKVVDNSNSVEQLSNSKPTWYPRSLMIRKDSQLVVDSFWPQLSQEINSQLYDKLLIPYLNEFSTLQYCDRYINGAVILQKTEPGEGYHQWHDENTGWMYRHRTFAWMIYLNDVEEGGETEFLYYSTRFKPRANTGLLWPGGFTHTHRGNPPLSGTKYILTGWMSPIDKDIIQLKTTPPLQDNNN